MATRGTIAVLHKDGSVSQIYTHWDSYLSHNGRILFENYVTRKQVEELVSYGDLSVLGANVCAPDGENHSYEHPIDGVTVYYGRDRGETGTEPRKFSNITEYYNKRMDEEFNYLFTGLVWKVNYGTGWKLLTADMVNS